MHSTTNGRYAGHHVRFQEAEVDLRVCGRLGKPSLADLKRLHLHYRITQAGGKSIAIFRLGGAYYAIENTCPHRGGPLSEGEVEDDVVTCPWHGSRFNIKTGALLTPPAREGVKSFPVRIAGDPDWAPLYMTEIFLAG